MDTIHARTYDDRWGSYINPSHRMCVEAVVERLPTGAAILDAACGTGKYWAMLLTAGVHVVGVDQSQLMLEVAKHQRPTVPVIHASLQDIASSIEVTRPLDGLLCVDAMENVGPEDWPVVLDGLASVLRPGAPAYVTVELPEGDITMDAEAESAPLVDGEVLEDGAYHFCPSPDAARAWLLEHRFRAWSETEGDGYHHFLLTRQ
jgi:SAM-dependent methyltransferase